MNAKRFVWTSLAAVAVFRLTSPAAAADGPYFAWAGLPTPAFLSANVYRNDNVPYFAVHPPVYYSFPESRSYGLLPYPYLPAPSAQHPQQPCPMVVENPYVQRPEVLTNTSLAATGPEALLNPYVARSGDAPAKPESRLPSRVDVIYPAQMFAATR